MNLLIKGMDIPKGCFACRCCVPEDVDSDSTSYYCALNSYLAWSTEHDIPDSIEVGCPLSEIPTPHGRLIDADELMKVIESNDYMLKSYFNSTDRGMFTIGIKQAIDEAPTIIEAEEK